VTVPRSHRILNASRLLTCGLILTGGCSGGPSRVTPPDIDADDAAAEAMTLYDKDRDGSIAGSELEGAPALQAAMTTLDVNKDGRVQPDEIATRIESWSAGGGGGLTAFTGIVTLDGRPIEGATVTYDPEPFLGDEVKTAVGVTSALGMMSPTIPKDERPEPDWPAGIQTGLFSVRISKEVGGVESIPSKYNAETTLGQEVSADDPAISENRVKYALTTK
jgi:hypothetical protein